MPDRSAVAAQHCGAAAFIGATGLVFGSFLPSFWSSTNHSSLGSEEPTLLFNQVNNPFRSITSRKAVITVCVDSSCTSCAYQTVRPFSESAQRL